MMRHKSRLMPPIERLPAWLRPGAGAIWHTLRFRFALAVSVLLLLVLLIFSLFVYNALRNSLTASLDDSLRSTGEQITALIEVEDGRPFLDVENDETNPDAPDLERLRERSMSIRVLDADGALTYGNGPFLLLPVPQSDAPGTRFDTLRDPLDDDEQVRAFTITLTANGRVIGYVQTAQSLEGISDTLEQLSGLLQVGIPVFVLVSGLGGYWLATRALAPVDKITTTARRISAEDLSTRLDLPNTNDEIGRLAATLDMMLARLDDSFQREKQFTSDASHELRTPLATIRTIIEMTRSRPRDAQAYEHALDDVYEEAQRLQTLIEHLLTLARQDQVGQAAFAPVDLGTLLHDVSDLLRPLAEDQGLALIYNPPQTAVTVNADYEMLTRLFLNLIDNAIKYTESGSVTVDCRVQGKHVEIRVQDTGVGIAADHLPHIFDRFYRGDASRTSEGTGLGLTIAQSIVAAHQGTIHAASTPGQGTTITVTLPV